MRTVIIVVAMVMSAVAHFGVAEAQTSDANAPAAVVLQTAKKAWVARAIDDILSAPVEPANHTPIRQGRSASRSSQR